MNYCTIHGSSNGEIRIWNMESITLKPQSDYGAEKKKESNQFIFLYISTGDIHQIIPEKLNN